MMNKFDQLYESLIALSEKMPSPNLVLDRPQLYSQEELEAATKFKAELDKIDPSEKIWSTFYAGGPLERIASVIVPAIVNILNGVKTPITDINVKFYSGGPIISITLDQVKLSLTYFKTNKFTEVSTREEYTSITGDITKVKVAKEINGIITGILRGRTLVDLGYNNDRNRINNLIDRVDKSPGASPDAKSFFNTHRDIKRMMGK